MYFGHSNARITNTGIKAISSECHFNFIIQYRNKCLLLFSSQDEETRLRERGEMCLKIY